MTGKGRAASINDTSLESADRPSMPVVERLYEYDDYRQFLRDSSDEQKRYRTFFSHRYFMRRAGLSSPSFCMDVIQGKFNLTINTISKVIHGLGLKGRAVSFFEALVGYNQAKNRQERDRFHEDLARIRKASKNFCLSARHNAYFAKYKPLHYPGTCRFFKTGRGLSKNSAPCSRRHFHRRGPRGSGNPSGNRASPNEPIPVRIGRRTPS